MTREFEYLTKVVVESSITVEDIGYCAIEANNDLGQFWCLVIKSDLGITEIFETGPIILDINELPKSYGSSYRKIAYSDSQISKAIDKFLNDSYRCITQAREIDMEDAKKYFRNLADYI